MTPRRIGVLTGGGDCPGLNAVIRAVTKTAIFRYGMEVVGIVDGFTGLVEDRMIPLTEREVSGILHRGGTILGTTNRENPFRYPIYQDGKITGYADLSDRAIRNCKKRGLEVVVVIGGDGSMHIAQELHQMGQPVVGIPKTIDNDLMATDVTFGFDTAVQTATEAIDKLHTTAESHHRVMIVEVMGRNSGWIALYSGIAGGADIILIPEIPFTLEGVVKKIRHREEVGKRFSILVVAEGAVHPKNGVIYKEYASGKKVLGGIGELLGRDIEALTGIETRVTVLGHLQRGGTPSPADRILATRFGVKAVEMVVEGETGKMACLRHDRIEAVPISEAISAQKKVDPEGELVRFARAVGISFGD